MKNTTTNTPRNCLPGAGIGMFVLVLLLSQFNLATATPINRGTFVGHTVTYVDVTESSGTDPSLVTPAGGLFGVPTIAGDTLDFNPKDFAAFASGADDIDMTDGNLQFSVVAKPGKSINSLALSERGDTTLSGFGGDAFTSVTTTIFVEVSELNGLPVDIDLPAFHMTFTPSDGTYLYSVDGTPPLYNTDWAGNILIDIGPYLPAGTAATKLFVSLDNTLVAISQAGTSAFIQKKDFSGVTITVDTNIVPEPATLSVALMCLGLVTLRRSR